MRTIFKKMKNGIIYGIACICLGLLRRLSWKQSLKLGRWLGKKAYRWSKTQRELCLRHIKIAFPEQSSQERTLLAKAVFQHFGQALLECINIDKIPNLSDVISLESKSSDLLHKLLSEGKGIIFVTGHVGNWELMARALAGLGFPINTIGQKSYDPRFTRWLSQFRNQGNVKTIWRGEEQILKKMLAVLRRGEIMGLLIDQDTKVPGTFVDFFDRPAYTPTVAGLLAQQTKAPLVCGFNSRREDSGYLITVQRVRRSTTPDPKQAVMEDTQVLTHCIEEHIRKHPAEWVWMHQRFKTSPSSENKAEN